MDGVAIQEIPAMGPFTPLALAAALTVWAGAATAAVPAGPGAPRGQPANDFWAHAEWDDDSDQRRRFGPMPRPDVRALRAAGFAGVTGVDRDDGRIEIEGFDADGRPLEAIMDIRGRRVLRVWRDLDLWDRWDD
jgi:hypothetical protein